MINGSAPNQMLKKSMGESAWREKEILALNFLEERLPSAHNALSSDACVELWSSDNV